jgi:4-hydroxy-tetrahydrodipicolinate reductase
MRSIAIFGITGRMGQSLIRALNEPQSGFSLGGAIASAGSGRLGLDAAGEGPPTGVLITADSKAGIRGAAVAVDFSVGSCVAAHASDCAAAGVPLLIGTTGLDEAALQVIQRAAGSIAVLIAPNTSVGVAVVAQLASQAAVALGASYDVEIFEAHHRMKRDAPSGTALALGEVVAEARGVGLKDVAVFDRHGVNEPRRDGEIGFSVVRAGDIVGEHTVTFSVAGERVEITHRASDRITFARGALRAAQWLIGRPPGLYSMNDVLGLDKA